MTYLIHPDDESQYNFRAPTEGEIDSRAALELGADRPDQAWVLTDRDVWHANPFYQGPPQRHPEDDSDLCDDFAPAPSRRSQQVERLWTTAPNFDDEIPF